MCTLPNPFSPKTQPQSYLDFGCREESVQQIANNR